MSGGLQAFEFELRREGEVARMTWYAASEDDALVLALAWAAAHGWSVNTASGGSHS